MTAVKILKELQENIDKQFKNIRKTMQEPNEKINKKKAEKTTKQILELREYNN